MAKPKQNREFWEASIKNSWQFRIYYERLMELAISMFEWKNLPKSVDERFLELVLFAEGKAVFFKDEALVDEEKGEEGYLALRVAANGPFNVYQIPVKRRAYAVNGAQWDLTEDDSVIIFNNMVRTNTKPIAEMYASRLWDLDRSIDVNCKAQKTPVLILGTEQQRLTLKNLYMKYEGNEPFIFGEDDKISPNTLKVLSTGAPFVASDLQRLKTELWNECLTAFGISNISFQKKERLVTDEVIRAQGDTIASRYSRLNARRQAANKINEMFGLNIEVNFREDYREVDDENVLTGQTSDNAIDTTIVDLRTQSPMGR